jgi:hypothetical protein
MLESRWPKGPLIALLVLVPVLFLINPTLRSWVRQAKLAADASTGVVAVGPAQQGPYVVNQINALAGRYWRRVGGADTGLPPRVNGSDEFAAAWLAQMGNNLRGLPYGVFTQPFPTTGFQGDPAKLPGRNIIVFVPGARHSRQAIVIGSHYDGESESRGSAYDDTSGSAVTLGAARVLGAQ